MQRSCHILKQWQRNKLTTLCAWLFTNISGPEGEGGRESSVPSDMMYVQQTILCPRVVSAILFEACWMSAGWRVYHYCKVWQWLASVCWGSFFYSWNFAHTHTHRQSPFFQKGERNAPRYSPKSSSVLFCSLHLAFDTYQLSWCRRRHMPKADEEDQSAVPAVYIISGMFWIP